MMPRHRAEREHAKLVRQFEELTGDKAAAYEERREGYHGGEAQTQEKNSRRETF